MEILWLGYDGLTVECAHISAVLVYTPLLDNLLRRSFGHVPLGVQSVVLASDGSALPARIPPHQLRQRWSIWRTAHLAGS